MQKLLKILILIGSSGKIFTEKILSKGNLVIFQERNGKRFKYGEVSHQIRQSFLGETRTKDFRPECSFNKFFFVILQNKKC